MTPVMGNGGRFSQHVIAGCAGAMGLALLLWESRSLSGAIGSDMRIFADAVRRVKTDGAALYAHNGESWTESATSLQGFLYPPPSILFLWPFGQLETAGNQLVLGISALLAAIAALGLWWRQLGHAGLAPAGWLPAAAVLLPALATGPVFSNRLGQIDTLILLLLVMAMVLRARGNPGWAAALVTWAASVKLYPALLLLVWLMAKQDRRQLLFGAALASAIIIAATLTLVPAEMFRLYLMDMLPEMSRRTIGDIYNQSLHAVVARMHLSVAAAQGGFPALEVPALQRAVLAMGAVLLPLLFALRALPHGARGRHWADAATLALIPLCTPLGWGHSYALALPLLVLVAGHAWHSGQWRNMALAALCWALLLLPAHRQFAMLDGAAHPLWWLVHARYALAALILLGMAWLTMRPARRQTATSATA